MKVDEGCAVLENRFSYHIIFVTFNSQFNRNPYIEEEQTTQWPNEKVQKDKQRSTKHTNIKLKNELHETHLKPGVN
jgi:hypothetical protein